MSEGIPIPASRFRAHKITGDDPWELPEGLEWPEGYTPPEETVTLPSTWQWPVVKGSGGWRWPDILVYVAVALTVGSFIPAITHIWAHKSADDINVWGLCLRLTAVILWLVWGLMEKVFMTWLAAIFNILLTSLFLFSAVYLQSKYPGASKSLSKASQSVYHDVSRVMAGGHYDANIPAWP